MTAETMYNALRMANVGLQKGDEISVFMLGKAVLMNQWEEVTLM